MDYRSFATALTLPTMSGYPGSMRHMLFLACALMLPSWSSAFLPDARFCQHAARRAAKVEKQYQSACKRRNGCPIGAEQRFRRVAAQFAENCVAMNQIQVLGIHNAYHVEPRPSVMQALLNFTSQFQGVQYSHPPLAEQFSSPLSVRQVEIDVLADQQGGLFAVRHGLTLVGEDPQSGLPALDQPGFKVLHLPDIDFETTCLTFVDCLRQVKAWSDANPTHLPIGIQIETKEDSIPDIFNVGFIVAEPINEAQYDLLDAEIRSVFPPEQLITPDDIRGNAATLNEAVLTTGWPSLAASRGKVLFMLDNGGAESAQYRRGHASLERLVLFTNANPGDPDAAFIKRNDPVGTANQKDIQALVRAGYLVRTRADGDTVEARSGNTVPRQAAFTSGGQYVSTDYPTPDPRFTNYSVQIPDGPARCNPVNAPIGCKSIGIIP